MRSAFLSLAALAAFTKGAEVDIEGCTLISTGSKIDSSCPIKQTASDSLLTTAQQALTLKFQSSGYSVAVEKNGCCNGRTPRIRIPLDDNGLVDGVGISGQGTHASGGMAIRNIDSGAEWPIKAVNHIYKNMIFFWISDDEAEFDAMDGDTLMETFSVVFPPGSAFDIVEKTSFTKESFDQTLQLHNLNKKMGAQIEWSIDKKSKVDAKKWTQNWTKIMVEKNRLARGNHCYYS